MYDRLENLAERTTSDYKPGKRPPITGIMCGALRVVDSRLVTCHYQPRMGSRVRLLKAG